MTEVAEVDAAQMVALFGFIIFVLTAAVLIAAAVWLVWTGKPPTCDDTDSEGEWVTVATWLEDADGTRRPATPDAVADFWQRWDDEVSQ